MNRQELEKLAQDTVCACQHHELADNIEVTTDTELIEIINNNGICNDACDEKEQ